MANESAWLFWLLGTLATLTRRKHAHSVPNNFKYCGIRESLTSKLPSTWLTTSLESENISNSSTPNFWAALRLAINALYSASLLEARKPNLNDFSNLNPSWDIITILTPNPLALDAPSTNTCHGQTKTWHTLAKTTGASVNSATKSTNT